MRPTVFIRVLLALLLVLWLPMAAYAALPPNAITGFWRVENGGAIVHIVRAGSHYRGRLVWLAQARYPGNDPRGIGGQIVTDRHNPDPDKRDRPLLGLPLLTGLTYHVDDGEAVWQDGLVYNVENGKRYHCSVRLADHDHLKLHGYVGLPLFGQTTTWRRVSAPSQDGGS